MYALWRRRERGDRPRRRRRMVVGGGKSDERWPKSRRGGRKLGSNGGGRREGNSPRRLCQIWLKETKCRKRELFRKEVKSSRSSVKIWVKLECRGREERERKERSKLVTFRRRPSQPDSTSRILCFLLKLDVAILLFRLKIGLNPISVETCSETAFQCEERGKARAHQPPPSLFSPSPRIWRHIRESFYIEIDRVSTLL